MQLTITYLKSQHIRQVAKISKIKNKNKPQEPNKKMHKTNKKFVKQ